MFAHTMFTAQLKVNSEALSRLMKNIDLGDIEVPEPPAPPPRTTADIISEMEALKIEVSKIKKAKDILVAQADKAKRVSNSFDAKATKAIKQVATLESRMFDLVNELNMSMGLASIRDRSGSASSAGSERSDDSVVSVTTKSDRIFLGDLLIPSNASYYSKVAPTNSRAKESIRQMVAMKKQVYKLEDITPLWGYGSRRPANGLRRLLAYCYLDPQDTENAMVYAKLGTDF